MLQVSEEHSGSAVVIGAGALITLVFDIQSDQACIEAGICESHIERIRELDCSGL